MGASGRLVIAENLLRGERVAVPLGHVRTVRVERGLLERPLNLTAICVRDTKNSVRSGRDTHLVVLPVIGGAQVTNLLGPRLSRCRLRPKFFGSPGETLGHCL